MIKEAVKFIMSLAQPQHMVVNGANYVYGGKAKEWRHVPRPELVITSVAGIASVLSSGNVFIVSRRGITGKSLDYKFDFERTSEYEYLKVVAGSTNEHYVLMRKLSNLAGVIVDKKAVEKLRCVDISSYKTVKDTSDTKTTQETKDTITIAKIPILLQKYVGGPKVKATIAIDFCVNAPRHEHYGIILLDGAFIEANAELALTEDIRKTCLKHKALCLV